MEQNESCFPTVLVRTCLSRLLEALLNGCLSVPISALSVKAGTFRPEAGESNYLSGRVRDRHYPTKAKLRLVMILIA